MPWLQGPMVALQFCDDLYGCGIVGVVRLLLPDLIDDGQRICRAVC